MIAHRGGGGEWPEETIYAFRKAVDIEVDILELDVQMTSDGKLVLMHDKELERTTGITGSIKDMSSTEVKLLSAAKEWPTFKGNPETNVPQLEDVFQKFPNMRMNIEIKQKDPPIVTELCRLIKKYDMTYKVLAASLWSRVLRDVRQECPEVATSASIFQGAVFTKLGLIFDGDGIPNMDAIQWKSRLGIPIVTEKFIAKALKSKLVVHAWTVNEPKEIERMKALGVGGIITDYPSSVLRCLGRL